MVLWNVCFSVYDVTKHPKFISGEWSETRVFETFLASFDTPNQSDGVVSHVS